MKKYEYVSITYQMKDVVMASCTEHRDVIERYASQGYAYVGMFPTVMSVNGCL